MSITEKLASQLGRKDETPNIELAEDICTSNNSHAVAELFDSVNMKNKDIQNDSIKVIYEVGVRKPKMIVTYIPELLTLLKSKNNRLQWGAMTALDYITLENPDLIYDKIETIISVADSGSVITNDHCVEILIKLCTITKYSERIFILLIERLHKSPTNQLPKYAEDSLKLINKENRDTFASALVHRLSDFEQGTKKSRLEKVIAKAQKL